MTTTPLTDAQRVVVTGLGATTPLGGDVPSTWSAMLAGRSGVKVLTEEWVEALPVHIAAPAAVDPSEQLERVEVKRNDRSGQFALIAAREAWAHAGTPDIDGDRLGVVIATGIGGVLTLLANYDLLVQKGPRRVHPLAIPMLMPNSAAAHVGLDLGARAGIHTPVSACASGAEAVAYAVDMIRSGRADVVVAGGTEAAIHPLNLSAFAQMQALSTRNDEPERASRPYDKGRDGFVLGEGAGLVVVESMEHARARGATMYAEIAGSGITSDAHHIAAPDPVGRGATRAMQFALKAADLTPADVVHINAHATSTPTGDVAEARAIAGVLGEHAAGTCISATKSMTGHLLGAAGAIETIATVLALYERKAPPTVNLDDPDDDVKLDIVRGEPRTLPDGPLAALNNSFGFGGHNVALAVRSVDQ
ncbi:MAG: 3-oxoacyl-[acyl-carrier-protein] synthase [Actinomycetota bacterium]|nr:3-oxoacyl-[acyl-carrier-protein] synthase [Actinomycetota bacterium]